MPHLNIKPFGCAFIFAAAVLYPALVKSDPPANPKTNASAISSAGMESEEATGSIYDDLPDIPAIAPNVPLEPTPVMAPPEKEGVDQVRVAEDAERTRLRTLALGAYSTPTQPELGNYIASDIPNLMAPFSEISAFSLGHTIPNSKWRLYPHLSISGIFDDNIYLDSEHKVSDFYFAFSPGLGASYGSDDSTLRFRADYTASFLVFMKESSQDTVDQNASVYVTYALPKLTLGLTLAFQSLSGSSVDVGDRVRRKIYYVGITSNYVLDDKFSLDVNLDETVADYKGFFDSNEPRIQTWLNYQATGKLNVGIGATFGMLQVDDGPDQTYEQLLARVNYNATGKLVLYASGGVELRQSDTETVSPVFSIGAAYSPTATTTITLDIYERIYGSAALEGVDYRSTGISLSLTQQLRNDLSGIIVVGYENANYFAVSDDLDFEADRVDHYVYARIGPDWQIKPWWHLGAFYEFSRNASSGDGGRSFTRNRVGVQANFAF